MRTPTNDALRQWIAECQTLAEDIRDRGHAGEGQEQVSFSEGVLFTLGKLEDFVNKLERREPGIKIAEAGVDPAHQTIYCDLCRRVLVGDDDEVVKICDHNEYLTLCRGCYDAAWNNVR